MNNPLAISKPLAAALEREFASVEMLHNDGRHGIGWPWVVARGMTRPYPPALPGTVYIGTPATPHLRRLYLHPCGYVVEGGRGGARVFGPITGPPHPYVSGIGWTGTIIRARTILLAVEIVEALTKEEPWTTD